MNVKHLLALAASILLLTTSCEDETATLGVAMMPVTDLMNPTTKTYEVKTSSYAVGDAVLARTSRSYLGRFTDPETGTTVKSDFLAQFHCDESFALPDRIVNDECTSVDVNLFVDKFVGDSLASFKLSVYELDEQLDANKNYYTNINPEDYYDQTGTPIATKWFTLSDRTITDSARWASGYNNNIRVSLDPSVGTKIIKDYRQHPEHFAGTSAWLNSGNPCSKGLYFKLEQGDGAMAYIYVVQLNLHFRYYDTGYAKDTTGLSSFAATEEVVEATRFENINLNRLLANTDTTYLKSPAGIFTLAEIPADQINLNDTINSAKLTFTRYNDKPAAEKGQDAFKLDIPQTILLVRLDDYLNGFFENYQVSDNKTSYITTFNSSNNTYTFNNVARLLTKMAKEKAEGTATANWNKVLLIPVEATYDSSNNLVKLNHDFSMSSAKLVGGDNDRVLLEVIYSSFK